MKLPFYIALRYLFSKKTHNAINLISIISVCGVIIASVALVCALSVLNGFNGLVASLFGAFDPELKITARYGKVFDPSEPEIVKALALPQIEKVAEVLQENALLKFKDRQTTATLKGVSDNFNQLNGIDSLLLDGNFLLKDQICNYINLGVGLSGTLGAGPGFASPIEVLIPKRNERINMANPAASLNAEYTHIASVYAVNQAFYDEAFAVVPISMMRSLLDYTNEVSALELKLTSPAYIERVKKELQSRLGENYLVKDRHEQQEASFKMMQVEKWMTFLILTFILVIALFNVVSSLSMLILEKKEDVRTLRFMGADDKLISRIFLIEGWLIAGLGALFGVAIGVVLCLLQEQFGFISMGDSSGTFIIDAYPVELEWGDIAFVLATVSSIGFLAAYYPVYYLSKKWLQ